MKSITIRHKDDRGTVEYKIYTEREADELGFPYKYWYECEPGEWGLSSDGIVGQCIKCKWYPDHANRKNTTQSKYVQMAYGSSYYKPGRKSELNAINRTSYHTVSGKSELIGARKKRGLQIARVYVRTQNLEFAIGEVLKHNPDWGYMNWQRWCKTKEFTTMVSTELTKILANAGFSKAKTLELLSETVHMAREKNNSGAMLKAVEILVKMHGMDKPDSTVKTNEITANKTGSYLDKAQDAVDKMELKAKQTVIETYNTPPGIKLSEEVVFEEVKDE